MIATINLIAKQCILQRIAGYFAGFNYKDGYFVGLIIMDVH